MTGHPSLKDARLKIEWAKGYLRDLDVAMAAFRQSKHSIFTEDKAETGETVVRARLTGGIDPNIQRLVGLIVTDLRSALDYMVCELAMLTDGDNDRSGVEFPIARNHEEFEKATTQRKVKRLPLPVREALSRLQPYRGGYSSPLWALNELRRQGIHHCLITVGHGATGIGPTILRAGPTGSVGLNLPVWRTPDDEPVILIAKGSGNQYNVTLTLDVCLTEVDGFERQAILPFLYQCAKRITGIVRHFDLTFFPKT